MIARLRTVASLLVALTFSATGLIACQKSESVGLPGPAPAVTYQLLDGTPSGIGALRGRVVLVNFWATTCATCVREMPQIVATHERFKARGFQTVAVAMSYDPPASVVNFVQSRKLPFDVVIDNTGAVARGFGDVRLTPTTFVIDRRGQIVRRYVGEPDFAEVHRMIETLLAEG